MDNRYGEVTANVWSAYIINEDGSLMLSMKGNGKTPEFVKQAIDFMCTHPDDVVFGVVQKTVV